MKFFTVLAAVASIFGASHAHLIMKTPVPFGVDTLNNSPLADAAPGAGDSDFPCKQRAGVYDISAMNNMKVGDTQELSFTGSASHGGGSCQLVYTTDLEPAANSTFKLFQSYEGGCPVASDGNTGTNDFTFVLPEGTPNGRLTLAWIWYNRVGNREIYMNCAPLDVTGGSDDLDFYDSLPNAYLINMPSTDCGSADSTAAKIPFPGQFILKDPSNSIAAATGPKCQASAAAMTEGVKGYKSATTSNGAAYKAPAKNMDVTGKATAAASTRATSAAAAAAATDDTSSAATASSAAASASPAAGSSSFITISTAAPASSAYPTMTLSSPSAGIAAPSGAAAPSGTASSSGSTCKDEGAVVCNGTKQFGLCNDGNVVFQAVAAGTTCENGAVVKKRDEGGKFRQGHVRRHLGGSRHV